jgi:two-component system, OmpR family, response regulator
VTDTVLVVDDSTFIVEGLVALLKKKYRAIPSFGGEECLQILLTEIPSVIILDIMMEPMDGWETLSRIKANPRTRHIPVLMFSAKQISFEEAEAHRIRIDDFLTKPVNPKELLSVVARILERQHRKRRTLSCWTARGVPPEKIEEYQTLSSNLDIDTSLLEVMKKQLAHPSITELRREELTSSLLVLEERIRSTGSLIEAFLHDYGVCVPGDSDLPDIQDNTALTCELPPVPQKDDTGGISPGNPAPESPGNADIPVSGDKDISGTASPEEVPGDLPSPHGADPLRSGIQITPSPDPSSGPLSEPGDRGDSCVARPVEPVFGSPPAEIPPVFENLFESAPRPEEQSNVVQSSVSSNGALPGTNISPSPDSPAVPSPGIVPKEDARPHPEKATASENTPSESSSRRRDAKVPPVPAAKPATGSSGRGILAVLLRILFGRRG